MSSSSLMLSDYRCKCGKLLLKGVVFDGSIEIKCKRCGSITKIGDTSFLDDSTHGLFVVDRRGFITEINSYASQVFGYKPNDIIGKNFFDYLPVSSVIKGKENFIHYCRQVQSYHIMQDVGLDVGGKPVLGDLYFTTIFNIKGEFTGYNVLGWLTNNPRL